jgi:hypothetical protein
MLGRATATVTAHENRDHGRDDQRDEVKYFMKAAVNNGAQTPAHVDFMRPKPMVEAVIADIRAAALTNLDVAVAERRHYFSPTDEKFVLGREGRRTPKQRTLIPDGHFHRRAFRIHGGEDVGETGIRASGSE